MTGSEVKHGAAAAKPHWGSAYAPRGEGQRARENSASLLPNLQQQAHRERLDMHVLVAFARTASGDKAVDQS